MRRNVLGVVLAGTVLMVPACGDDDGGSGADDPRVSPSRSASAPAGDEWRLVGIVTATAAGGTVTTQPEPIETRAQLDSFSRQFTRPRMEQQLERVWTTSAPAGGTLMAAVVTIGCEVPRDVTYDEGVVRAKMPLPPSKQCLAAMTSVAVISVG